MARNQPRCIRCASCSAGIRPALGHLGCLHDVVLRCRCVGNDLQNPTRARRSTRRRNSFDGAATHPEQHVRLLACRSCPRSSTPDASRSRSEQSSAVPLERFRTGQRSTVATRVAFVVGDTPGRSRMRACCRLISANDRPISERIITPTSAPMVTEFGPYAVLDICGDATASDPVLGPAVVGCVGSGALPSSWWLGVLDVV